MAKAKTPAKAKTTAKAKPKAKKAAKKKTPAKKKPVQTPVIPPEPWERQEDETDKAFEAFAIYRDMERRTTRGVASQLSKSVALISRWSSTHEWVKRAAAWDAERDRIARQEQIDEIKKMRKRHADLASAMLVKAARALQRIPEDEIKAGDVSRMVDTAAKLERVSRGDAETVIEERQGEAAPPLVQFYMPDNHRNPDDKSKETEEEK